jgi:hypothetical protein
MNLGKIGKALLGVTLAASNHLAKQDCGTDGQFVHPIYTSEFSEQPHN